MIGFRDFKPERPGLFASAERHLDVQAQALAEANEWIDRDSIEVINVESFAEEFGLEPVCIRVWYRTASSKPQSYPEV
jgi:hypothetical protein